MGKDEGSASASRTSPNGDAAVGGQRRRWLVLVYRVPSEPTRLRATVWRRLKSIGAVYLQNSVAAMPATIGTDRALRALRNEIVEEIGGTALLMMSETLVGEAEIVDAFNSARDDEYDEIIARCEEFLANIQAQVKQERLTYASLEENDDNLAKLRKSVEKVRGRDLLSALNADRADDCIAECSQALNEFADRVYQVDSAANSVLRKR